MTIRVAVLMDPIESIHIEKDSTFAMCLAAQARGWPLHYFQQSDLFVKDGRAFATVQSLQVQDSVNQYFTLGDHKEVSLAEFDVILMRKDPPFDIHYIYTTYMLELAEREGVLIVNKPQSLRDANEKFFTTHFPQCTPPTLVTENSKHLREFYQQHRDIILKPLEGMGGKSVFRVQWDDPNINVIIETLTNSGSIPIIAQTYIPDIAQTGDKRILMIDGEPVPYALARIPAKGDSRGNLAKGATGVGVALTDRDRWICQQVGPTLREKGLVFVGLDVIGDFLTEINVTSPTCIREIDRTFQTNIADDLMTAIARRLSSR